MVAMTTQVSRNEGGDEKVGRSEGGNVVLGEDRFDFHIRTVCYSPVQFADDLLSS
jgi:hypothetical protein